MGTKLIYQPHGSYCCGQCCIAMAAGVDLAAAMIAAGRPGCTATKVLQKGLKRLNVATRSGPLRAIHGDLKKLPRVCILKTVAAGRRSGWHWVFKNENNIYCPLNGLFKLGTFESKITSYLEVLKNV